MKRITVCLLTCAFSAIMISELSSALIIKSHSEQIQTYRRGLCVHDEKWSDF